MTRAVSHGWTHDDETAWVSRRCHLDAVITVLGEWRGPSAGWDSLYRNRPDRPSGPAPDAGPVAEISTRTRRRGARVHLDGTNEHADTPRRSRRSCTPEGPSKGRRAPQRRRGLLTRFGPIGPVIPHDCSAGWKRPRPLERRASRPNLTAGAVRTRAYERTTGPPMARHHRWHRSPMPPKRRLPMRSGVMTWFDQRRLRWTAMERQSTPPRTRVRRQSHDRRVVTIAPSRGSLFEHLPQAHGWVCAREAVSPW